MRLNIGAGIALGYGLDDRGFESRRVLGIFLFTTASRPALGSTQSPIQWIPEAISLGLKRPGREAGHSPQSSAEVINVCGAISPLPPYAFVAWCSVKAQRKLYLYMRQSVHIINVYNLVWSIFQCGASLSE
jgi:hypothetical protein